MQNVKHHLITLGGMMLLLTPLALLTYIVVFNSERETSVSEDLQASDKSTAALSNHLASGMEIPDISLRFPQTTPSVQPPIEEKHAEVVVPVIHNERTTNNPSVNTRLPSDRLQVRLIKNALIALNNANVTGNYSVLREFCSPELRREKKASDFALAFHNVHDRSRDMSVIMELQPIQTRPPAMTVDRRMHLVGYFPTQPLLLHYHLVFLNTESGDWWLDGIVVRTEPVRP